MIEKVHQMSPLKRALFHWAVKIGHRYVERKYIEKRHPGLVAAQYRLADLLIFSRIRQRFGGNMRFFCSGGAPLDKSINEFFWVIGLPILEGYGLTETSPAVCFNNLSNVRFGSVGIPLPGTTFRVEADLGDLVINDRVVELFTARINEVNARIARYESIKKFVVLAHDFSIDGGELTPTLKLRRKVIYEKYQEKIDDLYAENISC